MRGRATDVVIIGAGVIGCSLAYYLSLRGVAVTLFEQGAPGMGASGGNGGLVAVGIHALGLLPEEARRNLESFRGYSEELETDIEYRERGRITLAGNEGEAVLLKRLVEIKRGLGASSPEYLEDRELAALEPELILRGFGGAFAPNDGHLNPLALTAGLARAARKRGARLVTGARVTGIELRGGKVAGVTTQRGTTPAKVVVNAAGAWAGRVAALVGLDLPIVPRRGQLMITERGTSPLRCTISPGSYAPFARFGLEPPSGSEPGYVARPVAVRPAGNGALLAGSTSEFVGYQCTTTTKGAREIADYVIDTVRSCRGARIVRTWSGFRPHPKDGRVRLGPDPQGPEGYINANGHDSRGVSLSPAHCRYLAQFIAEGRSDLPLEELAAD